MSSEKLITLKTSDGQEFKLDEAIAMRSSVIKHIVQDVDCASTAIPLYNVDGETMTKVIEYWKKHSEEGVSVDQLKNFDKDFVKVHQSSTLYDILLAANYLGDEELMDLIIQEVADRIKGKTLEEVCEEFDIDNDFTPEEEREIRERLLHLTFN